MNTSIVFRFHLVFRSLVFVLVVCMLCGSDEGSEQRIRDLVHRLGSLDFSQREEASKRLLKLGDVALSELKKATKSDDLEIRRRSCELIAKIRRGAFQSVRVMAADQGEVTTIAFSPDGKLIVSGYMSGAMIVWDATSGAQLHRLRNHVAVATVAFVSEGQWILSGDGDGTIGLWDWKAGRRLSRFKSSEGIITVAALSPARDTLLCGGGAGSTDYALRWWDWKTGKELSKLSGHQKSVQGGAISPDGTQAVSVGLDKKIFLWELKKGSLCKAFGREDTFYLCIAFSPNGKQVLSGGVFGEVELWDLATGRKVFQLAGHEESVNALAFSPDGSLALTGSGTLGFRGFSRKPRDISVRVWDLENRTEIYSFRDHKAEVTSVCISPDGKMAAAGGNDGTVCVMRIPTQ